MTIHIFFLYFRDMCENWPTSSLLVYHLLSMSGADNGTVHLYCFNITFSLALFVGWEKYILFLNSRLRWEFIKESKKIRMKTRSRKRSRKKKGFSFFLESFLSRSCFLSFFLTFIVFSFISWSPSWSRACFHNFHSI